MFGFIKKLFGPGTDYKALAAQGALIIDVRTNSEFKGGHIKNAVNIPVDSISSKVNELKLKGMVHPFSHTSSMFVKLYSI